MNTRFYIKGFTLIEIMIALSVVAIGLTATLKAIHQEINAANMMQNKLLALWVLENKMAEIRLNPILPDLGINQGQQSLFNQTWLWQTHTLTTANAKIRKVEISIFIATAKDKKDSILTQAIYLGDLK